MHKQKQQMITNIINIQSYIIALANKPVRVEMSGTSGNTTINVASSPKEIRDKLEKFDSDWRKYQSFVVRFENYLELNPKIYNMDAKKGWLLISLLTSTPKS